MAEPWLRNEQQIKAEIYSCRSLFLHSGAMRSIEPGISRVRIHRCAMPRNDDGGSIPRPQRLLDLDLQHAVEIGRRHRLDQLVKNGAVAADDTSFGHAIDAPFDRAAAVGIDADHAERIAIAAE